MQVSNKEVYQCLDCSDLSFTDLESGCKYCNSKNLKLIKEEEVKKVSNKNFYDWEIIDGIKKLINSKCKICGDSKDSVDEYEYYFGNKMSQETAYSGPEYTTVQTNYAINTKPKFLHICKKCRIINRLKYYLLVLSITVPLIVFVATKDMSDNEWGQFLIILLLGAIIVIKFKKPNIQLFKWIIKKDARKNGYKKIFSAREYYLMD